MYLFHNAQTAAVQSNISITAEFDGNDGGDDNKNATTSNPLIYTGAMAVPAREACSVCSPNSDPCSSTIFPCRRPSIGALASPRRSTTPKPLDAPRSTAGVRPAGSNGLFALQLARGRRRPPAQLRGRRLDQHAHSIVGVQGAPGLLRRVPRLQRQGPVFDGRVVSGHLHSNAGTGNCEAQQRGRTE